MNEPLAILGKRREVRIPGPAKVMEAYWTQCPHCRFPTGTVVRTDAGGLKWWPRLHWLDDQSGVWRWIGSELLPQRSANLLESPPGPPSPEAMHAARLAAAFLKEIREELKDAAQLHPLPQRVKCGRCPQISRVDRDLLRRGSERNPKSSTIEGLKKVRL
jgi:hypothetical protein